MAKKNYYGVKVGKKVGVFDSWNETSLYVTGFKGAQFKGFTTKLEAYEYVGLPFEQMNTTKETIQNKGMTTNNKKIKMNTKQKKDRDLLKEYRSKLTDKARILLVSALNDEEKNELYSKMSDEEINHYKKIASDLMERRFSAVNKHKELLDYLTTNPKDVQYSILDSKYKNVDLSITIYTIKAIINVMGESNFSMDDGSSYYNKNSRRYYAICRKYWDNIWWDTDTGVLSKEEIENKDFSEYHKNCNKIKTISEIRKYLHKLGMNRFDERYSISDLKENYSFYKAEMECKKKIEEKRRRKEEEKRKQEAAKKRKQQEELARKKDNFYKNLDNDFLPDVIAFNKHAEALNYDIEKKDLILYRTFASDKTIISALTDSDIKKIKEKALYTIEVHSGHEYNKPFILEAVNVLRNLIL